MLISLGFVLSLLDSFTPSHLLLFNDKGNYPHVSNLHDPSKTIHVKRKQSELCFAKDSSQQLVMMAAGQTFKTFK